MYMYIMSLIHRQCTVAFGVNSHVAWVVIVKAPRLSAGKPQQLSAGKTNNFRREKHNSFRPEKQQLSTGKAQQLSAGKTNNFRQEKHNSFRREKKQLQAGKTQQPIPYRCPLILKGLVHEIQRPVFVAFFKDMIMLKKFTRKSNFDAGFS